MIVNAVSLKVKSKNSEQRNANSRMSNLTSKILKKGRLQALKRSENAAKPDFENHEKDRDRTTYSS